MKYRGIDRIFFEVVQLFRSRVAKAEWGVCDCMTSLDSKSRHQHHAPANKPTLGMSPKYRYSWQWFILKSAFVHGPDSYVRAAGSAEVGLVPLTDSIILDRYPRARLHRGDDIPPRQRFITSQRQVVPWYSLQRYFKSTPSDRRGSRVYSRRQRPCFPGRKRTRSLRCVSAPTSLSRATLTEPSPAMGIEHRITIRRTTSASLASS